MSEGGLKSTMQQQQAGSISSRGYDIRWQQLESQTPGKTLQPGQLSMLFFWLWHWKQCACCACTSTALCQSATVSLGADVQQTVIQAYFPEHAMQLM